MGAQGGGLKGEGREGKEGKDGLSLLDIPEPVLSSFVRPCTPEVYPYLSPHFNHARTSPTRHPSYTAPVHALAPQNSHHISSRWLPDGTVYLSAVKPPKMAFLPT